MTGLGVLSVFEGVVVMLVLRMLPLAVAPSVSMLKLNDCQPPACSLATLVNEPGC
jgi:hypothetical protein